MILKEFFTQGEQGFEQQKNYNADDDISILDSEDTRKTRLTLKDINKMRLASEQHDAVTVNHVRVSKYPNCRNTVQCLPVMACTGLRDRTIW